MLFSFLDFVLCLIDGVFLHLFMTSFTKTKTSLSFFKRSGLFSALVIITFILSRFTIYSAATALIGGMIVVTYCLFVFEGRYQDTVLLSITFYIFLGLINVFLFTLLSSLINYSLVDLLYTDPLLRLVFAFIIKCLTSLCIIFVKHLKMKPFDCLPKSYWYCYVGLFSLSFLSILIIFELSITYTSLFASTLLIFLIVISIVSNVVLYCLFYKMVHFFTQKTQVDLFLAQQKLTEHHIATIEKSHSELRKIHHDLKNHYTIIQYYLLENQIEPCLRYINQLKDQLHAFPFYYKTGNAIADIVINQKIFSHKDDSIDFNIQAIFPDITSILPIHLCILLSNLLDNAIEALLELPKDKRKLQLIIRPHHRQLYIATSNYVDCNPFVNGVLKRREKPNPQAHGYGLINIRYVVDSYNGILQQDYVDCQFHTSILLDLDIS